MTDESNPCGLCGAPNPSDAIICVRCGALLAAYRPAMDPAAIAETPIAIEAPTETAPESILVPPEPNSQSIAQAPPIIPGSAAASIFGAPKNTLGLQSTPRGDVKPSSSPVPERPPSLASRPAPSETKSQRLQRLADQRIQVLEDQAKQPRSTSQPTLQQLRRKSAPARQSLLDLVARQPKEVGISSFVLFLIAMAMLGSGSIAAEVLGLFVLIAALIGGGTTLLVASRDFLDRHDLR